MRKVFLVTSIFLFVSNVNCEIVKGSDWNSFGEYEKFYIVIGLAAGVNTHQYFIQNVTKYFIDNGADVSTLNLIIKSVDQFNDILEDFSLKEVITDIDSFYESNENINTPLEIAFSHIIMRK